MDMQFRCELAFELNRKVIGRLVVGELVSLSHVCRTLVARAIHRADAADMLLQRFGLICLHATNVCYLSEGERDS